MGKLTNIVKGVGKTIGTLATAALVLTKIHDPVGVYNFLTGKNQKPAIVASASITPQLKLEEKIKPISYKIDSVKEAENEADRVLLARTLFGETRKCHYIEKITCGYAIINRMNDGKENEAWHCNGEDTLESVVLKPGAFSCFNGKEKNGGTDYHYVKKDGTKRYFEDYNLPLVLNPLGEGEDISKYQKAYREKEWEKCLMAADDILSGKYPELNQGQIWYITKKLVNQRKRKGWKPLPAAWGHGKNMKRISGYEIPQDFRDQGINGVKLKHQFYKPTNNPYLIKWVNEKGFVPTQVARK